MKTKFYSFILVGIVIFFSGCDETGSDDLLKNLAQGKAAIVIGDASQEILECTWINYGESMKGEVFINLGNQETDENYLTIGHGSWSNEIPLTVKTYVTLNESDWMNVWGSYGNVDESHAVTVKILEITSTTIKGEFSGTLLTNEGNSINIKGAFLANKAPENI